MPYTFNIPLLGRKAEQLHDLVSTGRLRQSSQRPKGCSGSAYVLTDTEQLHVVDIFAVSVADRVIQCNLFRIPEVAQAALIRQSPTYCQFDVELLTGLLESEKFDDYQYWSLLAETVRSGARPHDSAGVPLHSPWCRGGTWLPGETLFTRQGNRWTMTLVFDLSLEMKSEIRRTEAVGIDLGIHPLAVCAGEEEVTAYRCRRLLTPNPNTLCRLLPSKFQQQLARRLHHALTYHMARQQFERLLAEQLPKASVIIVEDIQFASMPASFQWASGDLGLADFLLGWLPQVAHAAGVPVVRVPPQGTSQRCARCHRRCHRPDGGRVLHCPVHGTLDADANAAQVIRQVGLAKQLQRDWAGAKWT